MNRREVGEKFLCLTWNFPTPTRADYERNYLPDFMFPDELASRFASHALEELARTVRELIINGHEYGILTRKNR